MDFSELIQERRSTRSFRPEPISEDDLAQVLSAASRAPTAGNLQNYSIIVTSNQEKRRLLSDIHFRQAFVADAGAVLTFCVDVTRTSAWLKAEGQDSGFENFWGFLVGMADAWSAAQTAVLAAESLGLGTCHSGGTFMRVMNLIDFFACPKGVIPVATLAIGNPAASEGAGPKNRPRLPLHAFIFQEVYQPTMVQDCQKWFGAREEAEIDFYRGLYGSVPAGPGALLMLYAKAKYPKSATDTFSENFQRALERQGFISRRA